MTEPIHVDMCRAAVVPFPTDPTEAVRDGVRLLRHLEPKALIAIERPGANERGHYHGAGGFRLTDHCAKVDVIFEHGRAQGIYTAAIGDGGNELGCAIIRETVIATVPRAAKCKCPCEGALVPAFVPDHLIIAAISNWGAYGIEAALAVLLDRREVLHSREVDRRVHDLCAAAEANNDGSGLLDPGTDAVPADIHGDFVELLGFIAQSGIDFGR